MKIYGLAGTLASGKDTVADLLASRYGFLHMSTSDMLRAEKKRVFGDSPKALLMRNDPYANKLRMTKGPGILVELVWEEFLKNKDIYPGGVVASGIRSIGEAEKIKELGGILVFVDADINIRYNRAFSRKRDKNDDSVTFDSFVAMEKSESPDDSTDKTVQNLTELKKRSDIILLNNGNDISAFKKYAEKALNLT